MALESTFKTDKYFNSCPRLCVHIVLLYMLKSGWSFPSHQHMGALFLWQQSPDKFIDRQQWLCRVFPIICHVYYFYHYADGAYTAESVSLRAKMITGVNSTEKRPRYSNDLFLMEPLSYFNWTSQRLCMKYELRNFNHYFYCTFLKFSTKKEGEFFHMLPHSSMGTIGSGCSQCGLRVDTSRTIQTIPEGLEPDTP